MRTNRAVEIAKRASAVALLACGAARAAAGVPVPKAQEGVHLSWVRAPEALGCRDAAHVQSDVARRLGRSPFSDSGELFVEALVSRRDDVWQAQIEMRDRAGQSLGWREVRSQAVSCDSLVAAAGLAIALMIDPSLGQHPLEPAPPSKPPVAPAALPRSAPPSRTPRGSLTLSAVAAARVLPQFAAGPRLQGEFRAFGRVDLSLAFGFFPLERQRLRGHDVGFGLSYSALGSCYRFLDAARLSLSGCGLVGLGAMQAVTFEPDRAEDGQLLWIAALLGLHTFWSIAPPFGLHAGVEAGIPFERRQYLVRRSDQDVAVFQDPALLGAAQLGISVKF